MTEENFRRANSKELALLKRLLEAKFPGRDDIMAMIPGLRVRPVDAEGSLELQSNSEISARVIKQVPVEAQAKDQDGFDIHVLLHVISGKPTELEIFKDDGSSIKQMPDPASFEVIVLPPAPNNRT